VSLKSAIGVQRATWFFGEGHPLPAELLTSKLYIPPLRPNLVPRPRLVELLNEGLRTNHKMTLVSAPAGFGKTTLVVAWLKQIGIPAAWLSLDEADNDLPRFLAYLAAALQQVDEGTGASILNALQSPQLPAIEKILTALLNEITIRTDPLILVLDDYHLLGEPAVLEAMEFLLHHQPPQLHLVLATREDPALPLARLRARDQLTEIRAGDLRFTQAETSSFLQGVMGLELSEQDVAALEGRTEGWAAGLQLAGLSIQKQADPTVFIADFSGSQRHILDYLTEEVLQQQPEGIRNFLLQTSILERLSGPLCDAVLDVGTLERLNVVTFKRSHEILDYLDRSNLFVTPLDEERRWYRYHHLFSDLLRSQLARTHPEWIPELHRRASCWYEENGDIQAAIDHALQDTGLTQAARLIDQHTLSKLYQGEVATVVGWFDRLPEEILESAPMMCISKAWALALMQRGPRIGEVDLALKSAVHALDQVNASEALRDQIAGHAASIQAYLLQTPAMMGEKPERLIALSQEALRLLPEDEKGIRSVNALNIGHGYRVLADLEAASLAYKQALEDGLAGGNYYAAIYGPINLVTSALLVGNLREALQLCETYIERFNRILAGQNFPPVGALYILKGSILLEFDRLVEAERALTEGLDLIRWTGEYEAPQQGFTALARLRAIQENRPAMLEAVKSLEEAWPEGVFYAQALRHRLLIRHWPDDPDVLKNAQIWLIQSGIEFEKLSGIQGVDPMNMAYFESYLGAAHVLACLAKGKVGISMPGISMPGISMPDVYPIEHVQAYLERQQDFASAHGFISLVVEIAIARTLLYENTGMKEESLRMLEAALSAAAPTGLFRIFVDECEPLQALLKELKPRLTGEGLILYANRLLDSMTCERAKPETGERYSEQLSERELEVLRYLAQGLTYEEIGKQLFLSLNTVQFHVKNIYGKLLVNRRVQAIEKAREMKLI
jgi:LuxR family maltose regulon positive regulatory protein